MTVRIGIYGELGMGNIGNDASLEAMLAYLAREHPDAIVDAMCVGARTIAERYGIPAVPMSWYQQAPGPAAIVLKVLGKILDPLRTASWVRRHDCVIVPGMGIFDATLPVRAWGLPYGLFTVSLAGRLFGTKVGYVSVGADVVNKRLTRWLFCWAARLASYRSCRDEQSREVLTGWGVAGDSVAVYPDLAFALPAPDLDPGDPSMVCVGVMDYHGSNDDRGRAGEIRRAYVTEMTRFVQWLLDTGHSVRLIVGDTNGSDGEVVQEIVAAVRGSTPGLVSSRLAAAPVVTIGDILAAIAPAGSVAAIRFHNVVAALMLSKPTIAISYGAKHDSVMADSGVGEFCQPVKTLHCEVLAEQFTELLQRAPQVRRTLMDRAAAREQMLARQFKELSTALIPSS